MCLYVEYRIKRGSHEILRQFVAQKVVETVIREAIFNRILFPHLPLVAFEIPIKTIGNVVKPPCMSPARLSFDRSERIVEREGRGGR